MTKFESRPSKQGLWDYVFFVDIDGHQHDAKVQTDLAECEQRASFLKVLGSYPAAII
jgi:chorismate mutase/prephenate dehydratase